MIRELRQLALFTVYPRIAVHAHKKLGHDPSCYIRDTLKRILDGEKDLNALLPENYKPAGALGSATESAAA